MPPAVLPGGRGALDAAGGASMTVGAAVPVVAIDGPSGVGKGMVTRWLCQRLGWKRLDSGALYRILALAATRRQVALDDAPSVAALAQGLGIEFAGETEHDETILINGEDWTREIRAETTGGLASRIAVFPDVRAALLQRQRDFRRSPGLIADGRDMGTIVFPDAALKVFLDASPEARAERRWKQLAGKGLREGGADVTIVALCAEIRARDDRDRSRSLAPLVAAADAVTVDSTHMDPAQVLAVIESLLHSRDLL